jgi:hypothetical protein
MADEDIDNIKHLIALNRRTIRKAQAANITLGIDLARKNIRRLKREALALGFDIAHVVGVDFDDPELDRMITVKIKLSTYNEIRAIVEQYGINLPEVE